MYMYMYVYIVHVHKYVCTYNVDEVHVYIVYLWFELCDIVIYGCDYSSERNMNKSDHVYLPLMYRLSR